MVKFWADSGLSSILSKAGHGLDNILEIWYGFGLGLSLSINRPIWIWADTCPLAGLIALLFRIYRTFETCPMELINKEKYI